MVCAHLIERVDAEVRWHEELAARIPKIAADFREGVGAPQQLSNQDQGGTGQ